MDIDIEFCYTCGRRHKENHPCPYRLARAYMQLLRADEELTEVDRKWKNAHPIDIVEMISDEIACILRW